MYKCIVARYKEDISWLEPIFDNCIVYNKGEPLDKTKFDVNEVITENVGRESHSYLKYVIDNYDNLPEVVIFTQGDISDHKGGNEVEFIRALIVSVLINKKSFPLIVHYCDRIEEFPKPTKWSYSWYKNNSVIFGLTDEMAEGVKTQNYTKGTLKASYQITSSVSINMVTDNTTRCSWDYDWNVENGKYFMEDNYLEKKTFKEWFEDNIDEHYPNPIYVYANAIFGVHRDLILNRSKSFYEELIKQVDYSCNPAEGHFIERSWFYIFM